MTHEEIDKWVEDHIVVPDDVSEAKKPIYDDIVPAITEWAKMIAHKFYELGLKDGDERYHQCRECKYWKRKGNWCKILNAHAGDLAEACHFFKEGTNID